MKEQIESHPAPHCIFFNFKISMNGGIKPICKILVLDNISLWRNMCAKAEETELLH
jgi:hypothetical protein